MNDSKLIFNFEKEGKIFDPNGQSGWMTCYSQVPTLFPMGEDLRILFTTRYKLPGDPLFVSTTGYIDVDLQNPKQLLRVSKDPVLSLGGPGTFDEFGIMPGSIIRIGDLHYFYYTGWTRTHTVPHSTSIGLAVSNDGGNTFRKIGEGPLFSRTFNEPYLENGPYVKEFDGIFHMWYASGTKWLYHNGKYESIYVIMHAYSHDGINWVRDGKPTLEASFENEALNRPCVIKLKDTYHMWYSYRAGTDFRGAGNGYRMGHAVSKDLFSWTRDDENSGLALSDEGWDSEMQAYPDVMQLGDELLMFYNGNTFGKDGIGYAKMKFPGAQ